MTRGDEKDMVRKIFNKAISAVTTTLLAFTTLASAIPVTTYAATTLKSKCVTNLKADAVKGFSPFQLQSNSSGVKITHSKNLTKAKSTDWIWGKTDQGAWKDSDMNKNLGNA